MTIHASQTTPIGGQNNASSDANTFLVCTPTSDILGIQGGAKRGPMGHPISLQIFWKLHETMTELRGLEIGELLQSYMLNTVINFLFKNFT